MRSGFLAWLVVCLMPLVAFSASSEEPEIVKTPKRDSFVYEDSSEFYRMHQKYQITYQAFGLTVSPVSAKGLNAGFFIDRNSLVQFEGSTGKTSWFFYDIEAATLGLHYKHFLGNSFYINAGADYRKVRISNPHFFDLFASNKDLGEAESIAASFAIGNQWQWQNFTLGCDWIGLMVPVVTLSTHYDSTGLNATDKNDLDKAWDDVARAGSAMLLRFYFGFSF